MKVIVAWIGLTAFIFFATLCLSMAVVAGWRVGMNALTLIGVI